MRKFEHMVLPRGEGGQYAFKEMVVIDGQPYAVLLERRLTHQNAWYDVVHLVPFITADVTLGADEPLPDGNGHPDHRRKK